MSEIPVRHPSPDLGGADVGKTAGRGLSGFTLEPRGLRRGLLQNGYNALTLTSAHAVAVDTLPPLHKDPFDRLLIAQALVEDVTLVTADAIMGRYPGSIRLV